MAQLKLITTGMIGEQELLEQQRLAERSIHTLSDLVGAVDLEGAILDVLADPPWTLHLDVPFSAEELRTTPITESQAFQDARVILRTFIDRAKFHATEGRDDCLILGREYGLTLVPMQAAHREEIRRMAELTALVNQAADTYQIYFAGGAYLTIKAPPPPENFKLLRDTSLDERTWHEDSAHENGNYHNTCVHCGRGFIGHKRRGICRVCATEARQ